VERVVALAHSDVIELEDLPPTIKGDYGVSLGPSRGRNDTLRAWATRYVRLIVERVHGNKREACRALGISYHTLQAYLKAADADTVLVDDPAPEDVDANDVAPGMAATVAEAVQPV
jgi:transcriptional regulator with AAA-type ATPase domain